jgi:hypothetical protein
MTALDPDTEQVMARHRAAVTGHPGTPGHLGRGE